MKLDLKGQFMLCLQAIVYCVFQKAEGGANKMVQWVKVLATKPDDLGPIPRVHGREDFHNSFHNKSSSNLHTCTIACTIQ